MVTSKLDTGLLLGIFRPSVKIWSKQLYKIYWVFIDLHVLAGGYISKILSSCLPNQSLVFICMSPVCISQQIRQIWLVFFHFWSYCIQCLWLHAMTAIRTSKSCLKLNSFVDTIGGHLFSPSPSPWTQSRIIYCLFTHKLVLTIKLFWHVFDM